MHVALKPDIYWVGYVDWSIRDFHSYKTERGTTYNAYLIKDEKNVLVDAVKAPYAGSLLANVSSLVAPADIDYVVCNHAEPDHSGSLPEVMRACRRAEVICNAKCQAALGMHYDTAGWKFRIVSEGDALPVGRRELRFVQTPMVHWPESMFTYVPAERLLFSMDAFGQHYASSGRFDDQEPADVVMAEAKSYYANILMLYAEPIARALKKAAGLDFDMIATSHGVIWRKNLGAILSAYRDWTALRVRPKVVILYDTMWKSTEKMAQAIAEGATQDGVEVKLIHVRASSSTVIATEVLEAAAVAFGSATLNSTLMPQMAATLTYLKGLKPYGKAGFAFGAYGWAKGALKDMQPYLEAMKLHVLREPLAANYNPTVEVLRQCREAGKMLAEKAAELASAGKPIRQPVTEGSS